jgi:divinyl protochlorophyllide a 8-vinyl-reductase
MSVAAHAGARIGPNAITRTAEALMAASGAGEQSRVFAAAGLVAHLIAPPTEMVDEHDVVRLHRALRSELGNTRARAIARDAGRRTGDYLLENRIPRPLHRVLPLLPRRLAGAILLSAMRRHAWTFAGSGEFEPRTGRPMQLVIHDCPLCRGAHADAPLCDYYAGTFERLFRVLVDPAVEVRETACAANGADACRFVVDW